MNSKNSWLGSLCVAGATLVVLHVGCGSDGAGSSSGGASSGSSGGFGNGEGGAGEQFAKIVISPADLVITVDLNAKTPVTEFSAKGVRADGSEVALGGGTWSYTRLDAAAFEGNKLVPTGFVGGKGNVVYTLGNQSGSTTAAFRLRIVAGTPPAQPIIDAFANATENDGAMSLVYPYDKTVFPRGLPTPVVQWNGGAAGNVYRIEAKSDTFDFVGWETVDPPSRYPFPKTPADVWAKLTDSTIGNVTVGVQRWDGTKAYKAKTQTWGIAPGNLKGTIYYTRLIGDENTGGSFVRRIEPGKAAESFLEQKPGTECIACHSVSRDGSRIVAGLNGGASPWAVFDAATGKELYRSNQASGFQAISPTGSHVLWRHWNGGGFGTDGKLLLSTFDSDTVLAELTPPGGSTSAGPSHPVWSPDGNKIAFSIRTAGDGLNFTASTLWTTDVNLASGAFTSTKKIVDANGNLGVVTYPTFSPDSAWIAFMRANKSRSDGDDAKGELWITSVDGATQIRLDGANGVPDVGPTPSTSWGPSMHPVAAGGYFWVAFFSKRPYGNTFDGANRQLWLAAIDSAPQPGKDPSHPAFYVTGQDMDSTNERPQFTVNPCKPLGQSCENGYDCCDGYCRAGSDGKLVCQQKGNECAQDGDKCAGDADCCNGSRCIGGFCTVPPPK